MDNNEIKECFYKGETYFVKSDGSVLRQPKDLKPRYLDNNWTFGKADKRGYLCIGGEPIHRIVAFAYLGNPPTKEHVVDHIDTNRQNNRPENLRWVTRLENIILNPITAKRIELVCGSVENFLENPSKYKDKFPEPNYSWMCTVTAEESAITRKRLLHWAQNDRTSSNGSIGDWVKKRYLNIQMKETKRILSRPSIENSTHVSGHKLKSKHTEEKIKPKKPSKRNPFYFPRATNSTVNADLKMYKTNLEIAELLKLWLNSEKIIKLPKVIVPTAGIGIMARESWTEDFEKCECYYEGKSNIPKSISIYSSGTPIALLVRNKTASDEKEVIRLKENGFNIVEIDLSWAKDGVTNEEMKYIIQDDTTKKKWLHHDLIVMGEEKLQMISEEVDYKFGMCPLCKDFVQNEDCWNCDYRMYTGNNIVESCFGKTGVNTYKELMSVVDVEKEDEKITSITYNIDGEFVTKKYDKEIQLPGKTLFQLWEEKDSEEVIVQNIINDWYVLLEENPEINYKKIGEVFAKLGSRIEYLKKCEKKSIYNFNDCIWKKIK